MLFSGGHTKPYDNNFGLLVVLQLICFFVPFSSVVPGARGQAFVRRKWRRCPSVKTEARQCMVRRACVVGCGWWSVQRRLIIQICDSIPRHQRICATESTFPTARGRILQIGVNDNLVVKLECISTQWFTNWRAGNVKIVVRRKQMNFCGRELTIVPSTNSSNAWIVYFIAPSAC